METVATDIRLGERAAVVVRPTTGEGWPGVVMIHEIWGVDDELRRQADRLAAAGFVVMAPDMFGEGPRLRCMISVFKALRARSGPAFDLIGRARDELRADAQTSDKVGVLGFCMGGGFALLMGSDGFDASSVNYGMIPEDVSDVLRGSCPVVASYGGRDTQLVKQVPRLQAALVDLGIPHDLEVYPTAGHSFLNQQNNAPVLVRPLLRLGHAGPEPAAAADAWRRIEAFFGEHLGSGTAS
ncbi:dienelactone hydrolase family protein [uncultured Friedmanniella sp.]|uniref:dienelactone hydrolase family protein n=1 Tax=uncultured Friedmanniella sp. TaxID=335381 RepID=UPI0035C955BE